MMTNPYQQPISEEISHDAVYEGIVRAVPQCILVKDRSKKFVWVSQGFCEFVGRKKEEIIGKTDFDFFRRDLAERYRADDDLIFDGKSKLEPDEEVNELKYAKSSKDEPKTVLRTKVPIYNAKKEVVGVLCTFQDISQQKRQHSRMLKLFVHDVPRPLIIVRDTYLRELQDICDDIESEEVKAVIRKSAARMADSIEFTLSCCSAYGFLGSTSTETWMDIDRCPKFYLSQVIDLVLSMIRPNTNARFLIKNPKNHFVQSDKHKIISILYSLVHNAVAATKDNKNKPIIQIRVEIVDSCLTIEVQDDGCGLAPGDTEKIFEEGYSKFGSSGVGLYIVKQFSIAGGGGVEVREINPGCLFRVSIDKFRTMQ